MYILVLMISLGYGQKDIKFQEFSSKENCEVVLKDIKTHFEQLDVHPSISCYKK